MDKYFEWDALKYGLDVPEMDYEHQVLIQHMNMLHELYLTRASRTKLAEALEALVAYTQRHFAHEEAHMARIGYPGARTHAGIHRQLLQRIGQFATEFASSGQLTEEFFHFLKMWLRAHICGIDTKYAGKAVA